MKIYLLVVIFFSACFTHSGCTGGGKDDTRSVDPVTFLPVENDTETINSNSALRTILICSKDGGINGIMNCLSEGALGYLDSAASQRSLNVLPGISLVSKDPINRRVSRHLKDIDFPEDPYEKTEKFIELIFDAIGNIFSGRSLEIAIPKTTGENVARAIEEGRGKMKKMVGPLMLGLGAVLVTMVPVMMGGLSLLSAKALIIGKISLVVSAILFVQYFFTGKNLFSGLSGYGSNSPVAAYGAYGPNYPYYGYGSNALPVWTNPEKHPYARSFKYRKADSAEQSSQVISTGQDESYDTQRS